ncbi:MAG TPA: SCO family protein [Pyrinomonadaceae bacterium]|jgi:protein SCO1/2|nr:SCO family protein [Pyrinomonadaceae bacterium]
MKTRREAASPSSTLGRTLCLAAALTLAPVVATAQTGHAHHAGGAEQRAAPPAPVETSPPEALIKLNRVEINVPEVRVLDQEGRPVRFYADLIKGKVVVVSFIYTTCIATCTAQGKQLARLQRALGEKMGREVFFVVVSTDPATDRPAKLKHWAETFGAKQGWTLITDADAPFRTLRESFPGVRAGRDVHEAIVFIGNDARGLWVRADGLRPVEELLSLINALSAPAPDPVGLD